MYFLTMVLKPKRAPLPSSHMHEGMFFERSPEPDHPPFYIQISARESGLRVNKIAFILLPAPELISRIIRCQTGIIFNIGS